MKLFTRSIIEIIIFVSVFFILIQLGCWQLNRAKQKEAILHTFAHNYHQSVNQDLSQVIKPFMRVTLRAKAQMPVIFLDNQFHKHQLGYHVLLPLKLASGEYVLADLGWLKAAQSRDQLPSISLPKQLKWQGYAYFPPKKNLSLGQWLDDKTASYLRVEFLNVAALETELKLKLQTWVLRVDVDPVYTANWQLVAVAPSRHRAYALQWFSMAAILALIFLWRVLKK
jgi:surfeit locus 1 family protein